MDEVVNVTHDDEHKRTLRSRVAAMAVTGALLLLLAAAIAHSDDNGPPSWRRSRRTSARSRSRWRMASSTTPR